VPHEHGEAGVASLVLLLLVVAPPHAERPVGGAAHDDAPGHGEAQHARPVSRQHAREPRLAAAVKPPPPARDQPVGGAHVHGAGLGARRDRGHRAVAALPEHPLQDVPRRPVSSRRRRHLPPPHLDGPVGGAGEHEAAEPGRGDGVDGVVVRGHGLEAPVVGDAPRLEGAVPGGRVEQSRGLVEAERRHGVRVAEPHRRAAPARRADVAGRVYGADQEVPERRERPHAAVHGAGGVAIGAPHPDLAVLVAREDAAVGGDHDGLDEAAAGPEPRELAPVPPHPHGLRVRAGVEHVPGGRQRVDLAVLLDERRDEPGRGRVVVGGAGEAREARPRRLGRAVRRPRRRGRRGALEGGGGVAVVVGEGGVGGEGPRGGSSGDRGRRRRPVDAEEVHELLAVAHGWKWVAVRVDVSILC